MPNAVLVFGIFLFIFVGILTTQKLFMTPKSTCLYLRFIFAILLFFPFFVTAQTDFSFTIGGNLSIITPTKNDEVRGHYYFVSDERFPKLGTTIGFKIQRKINRQFNLDYQLRLFNHIVKMGCDDRGDIDSCGGWGPSIRQDGKVDYFGAIHSLSFNFRLNEDFYVGIGGYYQTIRMDIEKGKYFSFYRISNYFARFEETASQAGCLGTIKEE